MTMRLTAALLTVLTLILGFCLLAVATVTTLTPITGTPAGSIPVLTPGLTPGLEAPSPLLTPGPEALADIPGAYLTLYREAATDCPGLSWAVLAGIGKIETNHGRLQAPGVTSGANVAGAGGPMQFLQATFDGVVARHQLPPGGASPPSRYSAHDAIHAAAFYLCDSGAPTDIRAAIFAYNHATWYVDDVLGRARRYTQTTTPQ